MIVLSSKNRGPTDGRPTVGHSEQLCLVSLIGNWLGGIDSCSQGLVILVTCHMDLCSGFEVRSLAGMAIA